MKILLLIFFFVLTEYNINAQNTWEFFNRIDEVYEYAYDVVELKDGGFVSTGSYVIDLNSEEENRNFSYIRKHNSYNGQIYKEVLYKKDSFATNLELILYNPENETYIITGEIHKYFKNGDKGYFLVTYWDLDLNLLYDTIINLEPENVNYELWFQNGISTSDNKYVILGDYCQQVSPTYDCSNFFIRIDKKGFVEFSKFYKSVYGNHVGAIIEEEQNNSYIAIGTKSYHLDYFFNKTDSISTNSSGSYLVSYGCNAAEFPINMYLCSVRFENNRNKGLGLFNNQMKIINYINLSKPGIVHDNPLIRKTFDFIDTSVIYAGNQAYDSDYFTLAKVNSNLVPYWIKYMSENDSISHSIIGVKATKDGGCILYGAKGKKVNFLYIPYEYGSWAIKLDANGNTVSTKDPGSDAWEITVFPNPSAGDFKIEISGQSSDAKLLLFDIQGREVKRYTDLNTGTNTFIFDNLQTGTYIWKLLSKDKEIGEGKWVKVGL